MIFEREGSTLGVMDDLQIAVHSYDGCNRGCPGCLVDTHFKNHYKFKPIISVEDMKLINERVKSYYRWAVETLNNKKNGYFGRNGYKVAHHSYTFRFGNHAELSFEALKEMADIMDAPFQVFSTAPTLEIEKFFELSKPENNPKGKRFFLEIIYDPINDDAKDIRDMILKMREYDILGYPEVLITRRLLKEYPNPKDFVEKCVLPIGNIETQMQFGRYTPSKTRKFSTKQVVDVDTEVEWLRGVAEWIVKFNLNIHPIPIGEYAVTFLDEYQEYKVQGEHGVRDEDVEKYIPVQPYNIQEIKDKTRDIFLTSLYIDEKLDLYVWSESMGQHVLDHNFGFEPLGNIRERSIEDIVSDKNGKLEELLNMTIRHLTKHPKCMPCRYKSFCASHAIPLFRKHHQDDGKHCYGYLPVIREFQKSNKFLQNMVDGFKRLEF